MKQKLCLILLFLFNNCTQNLISYVKTPQRLPLITSEDIFIRSGLIDSINLDTKTNTTNRLYADGQLAPAFQDLAQDYYTLRVFKDTPFTIKMETKNRLVISPFYSSEGIVYQADQSTPNQGTFVFTMSSDSGEIRMRTYTSKGTLIKESFWYLESQSINNSNQ